MSDINPSRMIPLHVADAAVAACEKEIQALREKVESLEAIIRRNTEYTQDQTLEIIALKKELERLRASSFVTAVPSSDYEKLKAENERLRKAGDALYESKIGYYGEQILVDPKHHSGELCRNWLAAKQPPTDQTK